MSTETEVKLLTLLNVAAIKKPRDLDIPGGQRGSPALNSRTASPVPAPALKGKGAKANGVKKRKSVIWGGELGPSGSTFGKKAKVEASGKENGNGNGNGDMKGKGKAKGKETNGNGDMQEKINGQVDIDLDEGSDDEGAAVASKLVSPEHQEKANLR